MLTHLATGNENGGHHVGGMGVVTPDGPGEGRPLQVFGVVTPHEGRDGCLEDTFNNTAGNNRLADNRLASAMHPKHK